MFGHSFKRKTGTMTGERRLDLKWLFLVLLLISLIHGTAGAGTKIFTGTAVNESGLFAYTEQHDLTYDGKAVINSRTTYYDSDKRVVGYLHSDYDPSPQFCSDIFRDLRRKYEDGVRLEEERVCQYRKASPDSKEEMICLPKEKKQIIGQGFHHFIVSHLEAITGGETFHVKLVLPSRLDQFSFRIRKTSIEGRHASIRLEVDHWFLRLFTPHVDVMYDRENRHLLRYEGISNVADASGQFRKVQILYSY